VRHCVGFFVQDVMIYLWVPNLTSLSQSLEMRSSHPANHTVYGITAVISDKMCGIQYHYGWLGTGLFLVVDQVIQPWRATCRYVIVASVRNVSKVSRLSFLYHIFVCTPLMSVLHLLQPKVTAQERPMFRQLQFLFADLLKVQVSELYNKVACVTIWSTVIFVDQLSSLA